MSSFFAAVSRFLRRFFGAESRGHGPSSTRVGSVSPDSAPDVPAVSQVLRQLVYKATCDMPRARMHAGQFGSRLRKIDPSFSYEKYGFTKLIYLLAAVPDIVTLERVDNAGSAPAYYVRAVLDVQSLLTSVMTGFDSEDGWVHIDSVVSAMTAEDPVFSVYTYGFSQSRPFLESHGDLVEFKPENPAYVRLHQARIRRSVASGSKRIAQPKRLASKPPAPRVLVPKSPVSKSAASRIVTRPVHQPTQRDLVDTRSPRAILHLSKFAGFTPQVLNQKVSELAAIALHERWYFGPQPPANFAYPILKSYLRYTFIRLQHERKVVDSPSQNYRAFNTGLLDKLLRPIYALLTSYPASPSAWELTFCIPGEGTAGKSLVANFTTLPEAANYLSDPKKVFYHLAAGPPEVDWHHVIKDNMERLPSAFLAQYAPADFTYRNTQTLSGNQFHTYKRDFATALDNDPRAYRNIVNRMEEALSRTLLKTQINYKTAVPTYYPNINSIDLLLPICLVEEDVADCALVARQADSGKYIGHTILTLRQAYNNARLICKLDEHWLTRSMTLSQEPFAEEEEDDSEEFEANDDTK